jgi:hypothetical protein
MGPSGAGKSTVAWALYRQVLDDGYRAAYVDLDQIGFCLPAPEEDAPNHRLKASNLRAMWPHYRAGGAQCLVTSGYVNDSAAIAMYRAAIPDARWTVCRLRASAAALTDRNRSRGRGWGPRLAGDDVVLVSAEELDRRIRVSIEDAQRLDRDQLGDVVQETDDLAVSELVRLVRSATGDPWPDDSGAGW